jgi:hypothetical protein
MLGSDFTMNIYIVARDLRLVRWVRVVDVLGEFSVVRFSQLLSAGERVIRDRGSVVLIDWDSCDVAGGINVLSNDGFSGIRPCYFICVNDMQLLSYSDAEFIRFALLQTGVGGVFSQLKELAVLMPLFATYSKKLNPKKQDPFKTAWESLPWKKHAIKSEP